MWGWGVRGRGTVGEVTMESSSSLDDRRRGGRRLAVAGTAASLTLVAILGIVPNAGGGAASPTPAHGLPSVSEAPLPRLPLEVNERVQYWMERFTTDQRLSFERFLAREGLYGPLIREKLRTRGMPEELLYLAMIESGFSAEATSKVAAVGLWQFMGPTAKQYGLRVDQWVDERRDPIKATAAALDYLAWLHDRYDSWYLAAAAYNAGPGRVDRALRRRTAETDGEDLYWEIRRYLPRETREYVPRMLAATLLARDTDGNGFEFALLRPYEFDRVWVPGGTSLGTVASAVDVALGIVRDLNPHLIGGVTPPGASYPLRVPVGSIHQVVAALGGGPWGGRRLVDD